MKKLIEGVEKSLYEKIGNYLKHENLRCIELVIMKI